MIISRLVSYWTVGFNKNRELVPLRVIQETKTRDEVIVDSLTQIASKQDAVILLVPKDLMGFLPKQTVPNQWFVAYNNIIHARDLTSCQYAIGALQTYFKKTSHG